MAYMFIANILAENMWVASTFTKATHICSAKTPVD